ncbi:NUDIX hydrolase [Olivibacter domesticus]|uniref:8-oxo-dGTP diphosphatase n=1 Tax=Olivibacter domesticus TaxID=407022 RepID=A0A1H7Q122_OLID1|nr:NUDIX domain-containing protein [Olivibacter domesticus]SEL41414.1 8-oxo-dGTP pyrophosphatase MutT, NUDIX family [Olivibacter domesticus]
MIDKLAFIEIQNNKILSTRSRGKDVYYIPGGKREKGETDLQALMREIEEELTIILDPSSLSFYGEFMAQAHSHPAGVMVNMRCYTASYEGTIHPAAEIEEVAWLTYNDRDRVSEVDTLIFDDLKSRGLLF